MTSPLVIVGGGGHAREVVQVVRAVNAVAARYELVGVLADGYWHADELERLGVPYLGGVQMLATIDAAYVIAIGSAAARRQIDGVASEGGRTATRLVHPDATISDESGIDAGFVALAGARVTTNVSIGRHVHLNLNATVSHDCILGDYATLSPGAAIGGNAHIGSGTFLGINASVLPGVTVGDDVVIGAGAVVTTDVAANTTVAGVPAVPVTQRAPEPRPGS